MNIYLVGISAVVALSMAFVAFIMYKDLKDNKFPLWKGEGYKRSIGFKVNQADVGDDIVRRIDRDIYEPGGAYNRPFSDFL